MPQVFDGMGTNRTELVRLKVKRAKHHIGELDGRIETFFRGGADPYPVIREDDPKTGDLVFKLGKCTAVPPDFAAIFGDVLQNLRTALDHLAWQLVIANGKKPIDGQTGFPIAETSDKFEASFDRKVEGMSQGAIRMIRALKPYGGGNEDLWGLHSLNNVDKHRSLFVVGASHTGIGMDFSKHFPGMDLPPTRFFLKPADYAWPLKDGTELFRIFKDSRSPQVDENPEFTFQIAFGDAEVMQGEPLLPPLHQLADLIDAIVLTFRSLLA
jgi:hypothetical protein